MARSGDERGAAAAGLVGAVVRIARRVEDRGKRRIEGILVSSLFLFPFGGWLGV